MSSSDAVISDFRLALDELATNNKNLINCLTLLAEDYKRFSAPIVETIESRVYTVPIELKLPVLYVADSIIKQLVNTSYRADFSRVIVKMFLHVFMNGNEAVRASLYKLRQSWKEIFPSSLLHELDMQVKARDQAWPLATLVNTTGGSRTQHVHVNPNFLQFRRVADPRQAGHRIPRRPKSVEEHTGSTDIVGSIMTLTPSNSWRNLSKNPTLTTTAPVGFKRPSDQQDFPERSKRPSPFTIEDVDLRKVPRSFETKMRLSAPRLLGCTDFDERTDSNAQRLVSPNQLSSKTGTIPEIGCISDSAFLSPPAKRASLPGISPTLNPCSPIPSYPPPVSSVVPNVLGHAAPVVHISSSLTTSTSMPELRNVAAPTVTTVEITNEALKLEGIPANNRIFVDGRAHEVIYIQDTAVIERNGLPHRIFFSGPPRNVVIDGIPHRLGFGELLTVYIDKHPHTLRFGAPSRELYMGDFPFKGVFGGPPIIAHINAKRHEIRLSGPAPEVKIDPEPAYDLHRFMHQYREQKQPEKPETEKITDFLSCVLKKVKEISQTSPVVEEKKPIRESVDVIDPIPCGDKLDHMERTLAPTTSLRDFSMRTLRMRYDAIVNALHEKRKDACAQCGMRIDLKSDKYMQHMDWHVKRNLQTLENKTSFRPWYSPAKDWLRSGTEHDQPSSDSPKRSKDGTVSYSTIDSCSAESAHCVVCGEEFHELYNFETDGWMFKDCVKVDGKLFHSGCETDASNAGFSSRRVKKEADSKEYDNYVDSFDKEMKPTPVYKF